MKVLKAGSYKCVWGGAYETPKELWGFRSAMASGRSPLAIAREFLRAQSKLLGLDPDLAGLEFVKTLPSVGAFHVIFQQHHARLRIHRAYVTVHIGRHDRRVYLIKNRAMPDAMLPRRPKSLLSRADAERIARRRIRSNAQGVRTLGVERIWFPKNAALHLTWRIRLHREKPREEWILYVDALTGSVRGEYDNLASASGRAWVFDPNPVIALNGSTGLLTPKGRPRQRIPDAAYSEVQLMDLDGRGRLAGRNVTTRPTIKRVRARSGDFFFEARNPGFEEAMVYFHIDRAIRYLEGLGFRGTRAIFRKPVEVKVHGTREDNSWYSPGLEMLTFGAGGVDDAEDAETILHEFGHALQDAIVPDFGQSEEAAAMGEGFGDYFAASFFADDKSAEYRPTVMSWDAITWKRDDGPPCVRRVDMPWTARDFDPGGDEHDNGEIWSATLWDIREQLGRKRADLLIIESHFQLDGFTSFARGARAIIDADANLCGGRNAGRLERIFMRRKIGPL